MAITKTLNFKKRQLRQFARVFREARLTAGMTQLQAAEKAFHYKRSHCKVSRIERAAMPLVDAHCLERLAAVVGVPRAVLGAIDERFDERALVARAATARGFWLVHGVAKGVAK